VQEVIDVARLWLLATGRITEYMAYESLAGWRADQALGVVQLDPAQGLISFFKVTGPTRTFEHGGKQHSMLEPIRMIGGRLAQGVHIDPNPLWSVALSYQTRDRWRPILRAVVALNEARYGVQGAVVRPGSVEVSMRTTLAIGDQGRIREFMTGDEDRKGSAVLNYADFTFGFVGDPSAAER
jgi:hypothetical protein